MSTDAPPTAPVAAGDPQPGPSPRPGAKALVGSQSCVLLVQERHADGHPFWTLPGGGARPGESLARALRRECRKELGCAVLVDAAVSEFWYAHRSSPSTVSVYTVFRCAVTSEVQPVRSEGVFESRWVDPDLPPPTTLPQVRQLLREDEAFRSRRERRASDNRLDHRERRQSN